MSEERQDLQQMVQRVVREVLAQSGSPGSADSGEAACVLPGEAGAPDVSARDLREWMQVKQPVDEEGLRRLKARTPARIGVGRTGPRYLTTTALRFQADHAVALDAVFGRVDPGLLERLGLFAVQTRCRDMDEYLARPDLGRQLDEENSALIRERCRPRPQVQVLVSEGLSSTAVEANVPDLLPALEQGLSRHGLEVGTSFFVHYGRVGVMNAVGPLVDAEVVLILLGERPGLGTAESLSGYLAYRPGPGTTDAQRNVISNIHRGGTPAVEAGSHLAELMREVLSRRVSGVALQREE